MIGSTICGQLVLALVISAAGLADPPAARSDEIAATVQIDVRVIQPTATAPAAKTADDPRAVSEKEAATPQRLTGSGDDVVVYLAPADQALLLAGYVWSPQAKDADRSDVWTKIAAPRIVTCVGQAATVQIGTQVPYMQPRDDGSLVVAYSDATEGLRVEANVKEADAGNVLLDTLSVQLTRVVGREPIPNVPFDVGRPILRTMATSTSLRLAANQVVIIEMPTVPGEQPVFVVVRAQLVASPT